MNKNESGQSNKVYQNSLKEINIKCQIAIKKKFQNYKDLEFGARLAQSFTLQD